MESIISLVSGATIWFSGRVHNFHVFRGKISENRTKIRSEALGSYCSTGMAVKNLKL